MRATEIVATRNSSPKELFAISCVLTSAALASSSSCGGTQKALPSPSKTNGMSSSPAALRIAVTAEAPTVLTCL
jgi:hypothetical protein